MTAARGKRVCLNETWLRNHSRRRDGRLGTIVGEGYGGTCWRVVWDDTKSPEAINKKFIAIIDI